MPIDPLRNAAPPRSVVRGGGRTAALAWLALGAAAALAETNPYYFGVSESVTRDSNLLRLADGQAATQPGSRGDTVSSTSLLAGFDQPFGRQHGYANAALRRTRYASNSPYDNTGYTANAGLDWSTIERVSGSLGASANRALYSFNTGVGLLQQRNLQDTTAINASVNVGLVTRYSLLVSAGHRAVRNSLAAESAPSLDFDQDSAAIGVRWRPSSATQVSLSLGENIGRYPKFHALGNGEFSADRFKQPSVDLAASLQPTGSSSIDLHLAGSRTHYDLNQQRDFSGLTGSLGWQWQPRGRTSLSVRLSRDTGQNSYAIAVLGYSGGSFTTIPGTSDYSQLYDTLRVQADYAYSAKLALTAAWQVVQRTIVNNLFVQPQAQSPVQAQNAEARDHSSVLSLGARWSPLRSVSLGCDLSAEQRSASGAPLTAPLHDSIVGCYGQFQLQQ